MTAETSTRVPRRISIVGASGSGKSHVARALAERLALPVYPLDPLRRDHDGRELARGEFIERVRAIADQDRWIIDGHYRDVRHLVWRRADTAVWLNYPLPVVAWQLAGRYRRKRALGYAATPDGRAESDTAQSEGWGEKAGWGRRLRRLVNTLRERAEYGRLFSGPEYRGLAVCELRSRAATRAWLNQMPAPGRSSPAKPACVDHPVSGPRAAAVRLPDRALDTMPASGRTATQAGSGPQLIELFSLPGAGKTTLTKAFAGHPGLRTRADLAAVWRERPLPDRARLAAAALLGRGLARPALQLAWEAPLVRGEALNRLVRLLINSEWLRSQSGTLLMDQGFLQSLWSILFCAGRFEPQPELLVPVLRALYAGVPARVVFIAVDPEIALRRISTRATGRSRFDGVPEAELRQRMSAAAELTGVILAAARSVGLDVETLDGSAPPDSLRDHVRALLLR